jgi:hypothetical protein
MIAQDTRPFIETPPPGIYEDIPAETYHQWDAISNSWLGKLADKSPKHFKWERDHPVPPSEAMIRGSVLHKLCLEAMSFSDEFAVAPEVNRRTKAGKADWAKFCELSEGKMVVDRKTFDTCRAMAKELMRHKVTRELLADGQPEVSIVWSDEDTGILCKARLDYLLPPMVGDVKTTRDGDARAFSNSSASYGYYRQAAFYLDGARACGLDVSTFVFATVESAQPHDVVAYAANRNFVTAGRKRYRRALFVYKACLESGNWPGRNETGVEELELPYWLLKEEGLTERAEL